MFRVSGSGVEGVRVGAWGGRTGVGLGAVLSHFSGFVLSLFSGFVLSLFSGFEW